VKRRISEVTLICLFAFYGDNQIATPQSSGYTEQKLYYSEINELLKYSADSSAFVGHKRLLSAECPNLGDLVPLRYTRATRFSNI
jgi:hypothetical protein